jgi:hypothetical protein
MGETKMAEQARAIGFIGLGIMGEPMCRHLVTKSGEAVVAFDLSSAPLLRLAETGVTPAGSIAEVAAAADILFVSLPSGKHLQSVCEAADGVLANAQPGQIFVDLGTSPLELTRELAKRFDEAGLHYVDAPVARTRAAAEQGTLAITVGAEPDIFELVEPLLRCFAEEVTLCGPIGTGQIVKILNNMVVVGTVIALSEAAAIAGAVGIETTHLFQTFSKGSADSFALRHHGLNAVAAQSFPEKVFSTDYMLKDIRYALEMAQTGGIDSKVADYARDLLERASALGHGNNYWPIIANLMRSNQ